MDELQNIKKQYELRKNDSLRKYEIKVNEVDVDIYVPFYSRLGMPLEKVESQEVEGFDVAKPEELLILKQDAELDRRHSEKGEKDRIDIMGLLLSRSVSIERYKRVLKSCKREGLTSELAALIRSFNEYKHFNLLPSQFKKRKQEVLEEIKKA